MECIEARALKSSFLSGVAMNISTSQQVRFDDVRCLANVTCDDFSVDDLFDFSDKYFEDISSQELEEDAVKVKEESFSLSSQQQSFNFKEKEFGPQQLPVPVPEDELAVPVDEVENLEWLSQIVDDSLTEISLCPPVNLKAKTENILENRFEPVTAVQRIEARFPLPAFRKPRGKRSRRIGRVVWTYGLPSVTTDSSSSMSYSSNGSSMISPFLFAGSVEESERFSGDENLPAKKQKKKLAEEAASGLRRCSHCQVQKTPQWRTGPKGPKTLCNACGVRYKSGRLFPEYRPACSPTFSQEIHSNSHRKVLEMRLKKDDHEADQTSMVLSF